MVLLFAEIHIAQKLKALSRYCKNIEKIIDCCNIEKAQDYHFQDIYKENLNKIIDEPTPNL